MHCVIASLPPETVTARSVELGSISLATWIDAPVISRISFIFEPPFPMREPHWEAGTTSRKVIGGRGTLGVKVASRSSSNFSQISVNALWMALLLPITVTMRSGHEPSVMLIFAPLCNGNKFFVRAVKVSFSFSAYLLPKSLHNVSFLAYYAANLL